ncbi:hypothetical protein EDF67_103107 [Sphingobacterium sp. JUb78]|nr:hypothetical protein [Sphingobacterium kitahiroshimense]TCR11694.1 hypothetical protein EDF67_103107 [Sphingobacterium sp. JUb78]
MGNNKVLLLICDDFYKPSCRLSWMRNGYYDIMKHLLISIMALF